MAGFPVAEAVGRSMGFLRLALRIAPPWRLAVRAAPVLGRRPRGADPAARRLLRRRARHATRISAGAAPPPPCSARRSARPCARGLRSVALDTTEGNAEARSLYAREGFEEVAYRPAARGLPGFVALVKPLS